MGSVRKSFWVVWPLFHPSPGVHLGKPPPAPGDPLAVSTLFSLQGTVLCDLLSGPDEGQTEQTGLHLVPRVRFECDQEAGRL